MRSWAAAAKPRERSAGSGGLISRITDGAPAEGAETSCSSFARKACRPPPNLISLRLPLRSSTPSASACLFESVSNMRCSMLFSETKLMTVTGRVWCLRQARAMRCSSFAGFQGRSQLMTTLAVWRFSPAAPESVLRKTRQAGSDLKALISPRRRFCGTEPVCQANPSLSRPHTPRTSSNIRSHSEKMITFTSGLSLHSSRIFSNSASFGQARCSGLRM